MSNNKELNLKISANSFEVKNLEIKDGRLELVLSAEISSTEIEESTFDYNVKNSEHSDDLTNNTEITANTETVLLTNDREMDHVEAISDDNYRYGEPVPDVEWQAINSDDDIIDEIELDDVEEHFLLTEDKQISNIDMTPDTDKDKAIERESTQDFIHNDIPGSVKVPISDSNIIVDEDDSLPDYLKSAKLSQNTEPEIPNTAQPVVDDKKASDDTPTVLFEREKIPQNTYQQSSNEPTESSTVPDDSTTNEQPVTNNSDSSKRVKFLCPRCHTPGSQSVESIGNIITCRNCGRALKLNIKR